MEGGEKEAVVTSPPAKHLLGVEAKDPEQECLSPPCAHSGLSSDTALPRLSSASHTRQFSVPSSLPMGFRWRILFAALLSANLKPVCHPLKRSGRDFHCAPS